MCTSIGYIGMLPATFNLQGLRNIFTSCLTVSTKQQTWKNHFFVNSDILGIQIWRKIRVNADKFKIATKQRKSNIYPNAIFFFLLTGDNDITMLYTWYLHILHHLQAMKMTFLKLFFICMFNDPKLAKKWTTKATELTMVAYQR